MQGLEEATCVLQLESNLAFESQHILHALSLAGVKRWIALSEGAGGTLGWLTVRRPGHRTLAIARPQSLNAVSFSLCAD